jgi:hypothetical protein
VSAGPRTVLVVSGGNFDPGRAAELLALGDLLADAGGL